MQTATDLRKEFAGTPLSLVELDEATARGLIRDGCMPFLVVISTPAGGRHRQHVLARHSIDAINKALDLRFPEGDEAAPRGLSISVKTVYTAGAKRIVS